MIAKILTGKPSVSHPFRVNDARDASDVHRMLEILGTSIAAVRSTSEMLQKMPGIHRWRPRQ